MKLPFESCNGFIIWYVGQPKIPIVTTRIDLKKIIEETFTRDSLESAKLKMAVFNGVGDKKEVMHSADQVTEQIKKTLDSHGWPYSYRFEGKEVVSAFKAYTSAFCFINRDIHPEEIRTDCDDYVSYRLFRRKITGKSEITSFSESSIESLIGPNFEYFLGLSGGDYLYFYQGKIKKIQGERLEWLSRTPKYDELLSASYPQR